MGLVATFIAKINFMSVIFHGEYKTSNFGDLLLLGIMAKTIRPLGIKTEALFLKKEHEKQTFCKSARLLPHFIRSQAVVFGGGGYISSKGPKKKLLRYTIPGGVARALGIPYIMIGPGSDKKLNRYGQKSFRFLVNGARQVIVRDYETATLLKNSGVDQNIDVATDLAFSLRYQEVLSFTKNKIKFEPQQKLIGLNFPFLTGKLLDHYFQVIQKYQISHDNTQFVWIYDNMPFNKIEVMESAARYDVDLIFLQSDDIWSFAEALSHMEAIFTSQLHVGIVAWTLNVAVAGLSNHEKTLRFYKRMGREPFQVNGTENVDLFDNWLRRLFDGKKDFFYFNIQRKAELQVDAENALETMKNFVLECHH